MFQGGFVSWFLFYALMPVLLYYAGLLFTPIHKWRIERQLSQSTLNTGGRMTMTVRMHRRFAFPLYYMVVEEQVPESLIKRDSPQMRYQIFDGVNTANTRPSVKRMIHPWFKKEIECTFSLPEMPRGAHELTTIRVTTGDIFGFIKKEHVFSVYDEIVVEPATRRVRLLEQRKSFAQGNMVASGTSLKQTNVVTGVREYMPGDKFSWIDWKQTARKNDIMTKEFEQEQSTETMIVMDASCPINLNPAAFEATVEVALSLMKVLRHSALQVGFMSIGEDVRHFPFYHDAEKADAIGQHLTRVQPTGEASFADVLRQQIERNYTGHVTIVITSYVDEMLGDTLRRMKQRGKRVTLIYVQASRLIYETDRVLLNQLQREGLIVNQLTEKELIKPMIEVRT